MARTMDGTVATVTGSSRGIGRGVALDLAQDGAKVAVNYVQRSDSADEVVRMMRDAGGATIACQADVSDPEQVEAIVAQTVASFDGSTSSSTIRGIVVFKEFFDFSVVDWDDTMDTNVKGVFLCSQAAARAMASSGGGNIACVASISGEKVTATTQTAYCGSKGAHHQLVRYRACRWPRTRSASTPCFRAGSPRIKTRSSSRCPRFAPRSYCGRPWVGSERPMM